MSKNATKQKKKVLEVKSLEEFNNILVTFFSFFFLVVSLNAKGEGSQMFSQTKAKDEGKQVVLDLWAPWYI